MSKSKIVGIMALVVFAIGIVLVGVAVAGEKHQCRIVKHTVKLNPVNVPGEEGHVIGSVEEQGIYTNLGGKALLHGWLYQSAYWWEANSKMDTGSGYGYSVATDPDGDKIYTRWEGKKVKGDPHSRGTSTVTKGTGKWEGTQGKGTFVGSGVAPGESYTDVDWEIEIPRRSSVRNDPLRASQAESRCPEIGRVQKWPCLFHADFKP